MKHFRATAGGEVTRAGSGRPCPSQALRLGGLGVRGRHRPGPGRCPLAQTGGPAAEAPLGRWTLQAGTGSLGASGGTGVSAGAGGLGAVGRAPSVSSSAKCRTARGALGQARRTVACGPGPACPQAGGGHPVQWDPGGSGCRLAGRPRLSLFPAAGRHPCTGAQVGHAHSEATGSSSPTGCHCVLD